LAKELYGYRGLVAEKLAAIGAGVGDRVVVKRKDIVIEGVLMPRQELYGDKPIIVLKLDNGYNIGVKVYEDTVIELKEKRSERRVVEREAVVEQCREMPNVVFLSTGGTIVSKVDYETGAVSPALKFEEIVEWVPELSNIACFSAREVMSIFSENIKPKHWELMAYEIYREMTRGVDGVVVAHGTDFMAYSAAAMAFAIRNKPVPVVFVGSQRSSDRPSTDSAFNMKAAFLTAAKAPFAESVVVMHGGTGDEYALAHRGVKVRKMHSSRRDAFQTINDKPLAIVYPNKGEIRVIGRIFEERSRDKQPILMNRFDDRVALLQFYPGMDSELIHYLIDKGYHGIVIAGSGLGHVSGELIGAIERAVQEGIPVVITTQCLFGRVNLHVYSTGRKMLKAGAIPASDMLPETAYVKLSWILGSITRDLREVAKLINENMAGEINPRHTIDLFPKWVF